MLINSKNMQLQIERIRKSLGVSYEEAKAIYATDCEIDKGQKQTFDLSKEKLEVARKFAHTGTRETKQKPQEKKAPTVYQFTPRQRKGAPIKENLIANLHDFLQTVENIAELKIVNKQGKISFKIGEDNFSLTLTKHNK